MSKIIKNVLENFMYIDKYNETYFYWMFLECIRVRCKRIERDNSD